MAIQTEFLAAGAAITDEIVTCNVSVTVNGNTYYAGWIDEITNDALLGNTNADYGAWTAAAKAGTRYNVLKAGVPGANEVVIDKTTGRCLTVADDTTLYFRYVGYGRLFKWWDRPLSFDYEGLLDTVAAAVDLIDGYEFPYGASFAGGQVLMDNGPTGAAQPFVVQKTSGEGAETKTITVADGVDQSGFSLFSTRLKFQPGEHLRWTASQVTPIPGTPANPKLYLIPG